RGEVEVHGPQEAGHRVAEGIDGRDRDGRVGAGGELRRGGNGEADGAAGAVVVAGRVGPEGDLAGRVKRVAYQDVDCAFAVGVHGCNGVSDRLGMVGNGRAMASPKRPSPSRSCNWPDAVTMSGMPSPLKSEVAWLDRVTPPAGMNVGAWNVPLPLFSHGS